MNGEDNAPEATDTLSIALHGPDTTAADAMQAGEGLVSLFAALGVTTRVADCYFKCDGCGRREPDRPSPDQGWTYRDGNDYCPECSRSAAVDE